MPIKFSCMMLVFLFGCSEKDPVSSRAQLSAQAMAAPDRQDPTGPPPITPQAMAAPDRQDPTGPPPITPVRAGDVDIQNPWAFYRRLDDWEAKTFKQVTNCLTPDGLSDIMFLYASLHRSIERAKELEKYDPGGELPRFRLYIQKGKEDIARQMKRRSPLGDGFHMFPYYFKPDLEQTARLDSATFYEAVVPENSPLFLSLLYWPEGVEPKLVEWQKGQIAESIGGKPPGPQVGKGWSQPFYLVPAILDVEIKRPRKFTDVLPALTKLANEIEADLLSVRMWNIHDFSNNTLKVRMLYRREPELAVAARKVSFVRRHPLIKRAYIGTFQNQGICAFQNQGIWDENIFFLAVGQDDVVTDSNGLEMAGNQFLVVLDPSCGTDPIPLIEQMTNSVLVGQVPDIHAYQFQLSTVPSKTAVIDAITVVKLGMPCVRAALPNFVAPDIEEPVPTKHLGSSSKI